MESQAPLCARGIAEAKITGNARSPQIDEATLWFETKENFSLN